MSFNRISIQEPNGAKRTRPLNIGNLTLGREPDNDLVLAYTMVSRHHARITFDGKRCQVTDLESGNGTFIGNTRLKPNEPTNWDSTLPLGVGPVKIYLQQEQAAESAAAGGATMIWGTDKTQSVASPKKKGLPAWVWIVIVGVVLLLAAALTVTLVLILR